MTAAWVYGIWYIVQNMWCMVYGMSRWCMVYSAEHMVYIYMV